MPSPTTSTIRQCLHHIPQPRLTKLIFAGLVVAVACLLTHPAAVHAFEGEPGLKTAAREAEGADIMSKAGQDGRRGSVEGGPTDSAPLDDASGYGLYFDAAESLYVINLPDYRPIWYRAGLSQGERITTFDDPVVAPMTQITLGWNNSKGAFVEIRGRIAQSAPTEENDYSPYGTYTKVGYFPVSGKASGSAGAGTTGTAYTRTELRFSQLSGDLVAGMRCKAWGQRFDLFAGYWSMKLDQDYSLGYRSSTGDTMTLSDDVGAAYNGVLAGVRFHWRTGPVDLTMETTHGISSVSARYRSKMSSAASGNSLTSMTKHECSYRGTFEGTASTHIWDRLDIGLTGGLQYISYVPQVLGSGQAGNGGSFYGPAGPAHIDRGKSLAGSLGLKLGYSF